jgi:hypothetical protein
VFVLCIHIHKPYVPGDQYSPSRCVFIPLPIYMYIHLIAPRVDKVRTHFRGRARTHTRIREHACTHTHILYVYVHKHSHRYLCHALFFIMVGYGVHHDDSALWLLPHLGRRTDPAKMIGDYFKDLCADGNEAWKSFCVKALPTNPNAQGTRKGCNPQSRLFCLPRANCLYNCTCMFNYMLPITQIYVRR